MMPSWSDVQKKLNMEVAEQHQFTDWLDQTVKEGPVILPSAAVIATTAAAATSTSTTVNLKQGSPEWFAARKNRLTGSNIAAAVGLSPYATPHSLWEKITGKLGHNLFISSKETRHGNENENKVVKLYESVTSRLVHETGFWIHPMITWIGASPDGLVEDRGVLEIKCPLHKVHEKVPSYYMPQVKRNDVKREELCCCCCCCVSPLLSLHLCSMLTPLTHNSLIMFGKIFFCSLLLLVLLSCVFPMLSLLQLQAELACTERDWVDFCSWWGGNRSEGIKGRFRIIRYS